MNINQKNIIEFNRDFNRKLKTDVFTTIRVSSREKRERFLKLIGEPVTCLNLETGEETPAILRDVIEVMKPAISDTIIKTDTGEWDIDKANNILKQYGITQKTKCLILILERIKKTDLIEDCSKCEYGIKYEPEPGLTDYHCGTPADTDECIFKVKKDTGK